MTLAVFSLLGVRPACAQWTVTDKAGDTLTPNQDGSGYPLRGPMTGTYTLSPVYKDVLDASQQPNSNIGYAFDPGPWSYQRWLYGSDPATSGSGTSSSGGGSTSPGGDYDPYHIWTEVDAPNYAATSYNQIGYLGAPWNENINGTISTSTGGTLWAIFQWSDPYRYYGTPPTYINVLLQTTVTASAGPQGNGLTSSATATDSTYNETASAPGGVSTVKGRHLLRVPVDPNTGQASVSLGGTTTATASNSLPYGAMKTYSGTSYQYYQTTNGPADASASAHIGATANFDSRDIIAYSTLGQTYHKGPNGVPVPNKPINRTLTDDTVAPTGTGSVSIYNNAAALGSWTGPISYQWSQTWVNGGDAMSASPTSKNGSCDPRDIPTFVVNYSTTSLPLPTPATTDVSIAATDSDGATAKGDYFLNFHNPFEGFVIQNHGTRHGNWVQVTPTVNSGPDGGVFTSTVTVPVSFTSSATPGGPATDYAVGEVGLAGTMGLTYTSTVPRPPTAFNMPRNASCYVANRVNWQHSDGTVDSYGPSGYTGQTFWAVDQVLNTGAYPHLID